MNIRDRIAALPKGAKVAGAITGLVAAAGATWAGFHFLGKKHPDHKHDHKAGHDASGHSNDHALVADPGPHGHGHPLRVVFNPTPRQRAMESDIAVRRDIARLIEDVRRSRTGEPALRGVPGKDDIAKISFELGAYVAESLMARGIVVQMPDVPKSSAVSPSMTEEDGRASFDALVTATSPLKDRGVEAFRDLKESGVKFWAEPGTSARIESEIESRKVAS